MITLREAIHQLRMKGREAQPSFVTDPDDENPASNKSFARYIEEAYHQLAQDIILALGGLSVTGNCGFGYRERPVRIITQPGGSRYVVIPRDCGRLIGIRYGQAYQEHTHRESIGDYYRGDWIPGSFNRLQLPPHSQVTASSVILYNSTYADTLTRRVMNTVGDDGTYAYFTVADGEDEYARPLIKEPDYYEGCRIKVLGSVYHCVAFDPTTRTFTLDRLWDETPDATTDYAETLVNLPAGPAVELLIYEAMRRFPALTEDRHVQLRMELRDQFISSMRTFDGYQQ
jgi:hypothetical protein